MKDIIFKVSKSVIFIMILSIFFGAVIYGARQMSQTAKLTEVCFWAAILLIFLQQINRGLSELFVKRD